jgi:hypothetical protein
MATRDTSSTKRHVSELQSSSKLHKPSLEPKSTRAKKEEPNKESEQAMRILFSRELEKNLGFDIMGYDNDRAVRMEILSIQAKECFSSNGLLSPNSQRCSRDIEVQYGSNSLACV